MSSDLVLSTPNARAIVESFLIEFNLRRKKDFNEQVHTNDYPNYRDSFPKGTALEIVYSKKYERKCPDLSWTSSFLSSSMSTAMGYRESSPDVIILGVYSAQKITQ